MANRNSDSRPTGAEGEDGPQAASLNASDLIKNFLAAAATGLGILGFVTAAGGVVMFERFSAAGLPAEHGTAVVPRDDLLVVGAHALAPLVILVVVLVVLLWEVFTGYETAHAKLKAHSRTKEREPDRRDAQADSREGKSESPNWLPLIVSGMLVATVALVWFGFVHKGGPRPSLFHIFIIAFASYCGAAVIVGAWYRAQRAQPVSGLRLSGQALAKVALVSALTVLAVGLVISWVKAEERPNVQPAAVVTSEDGKGMYGLLIAETSSYVYIAKVNTRHDDQNLGRRLSTQMIQIPRRDVVALAIGTNQSLPVALTRARTLFQQVSAEVVSDHL